jgi:hypothetical protein
MEENGRMCLTSLLERLQESERESERVPSLLG